MKKLLEIYGNKIITNIQEFSNDYLVLVKIFQKMNMNY